MAIPRPEKRSSHPPVPTPELVEEIAAEDILEVRESALPPAFPSLLAPHASSRPGPTLELAPPDEPSAPDPTQASHPDKTQPFRRDHVFAMAKADPAGGYVTQVSAVVRPSAPPVDPNVPADGGTEVLTRPPRVSSSVAPVALSIPPAYAAVPPHPASVPPYANGTVRLPQMSPQAAARALSASPRTHVPPPGSPPAWVGWAAIAAAIALVGVSVPFAFLVGRETAEAGSVRIATPRAKEILGASSVAVQTSPDVATEKVDGVPGEAQATSSSDAPGAPVAKHAAPPTSPASAAVTPLGSLSNARDTSSKPKDAKDAKAKELKDAKDDEPLAAPPPAPPPAPAPAPAPVPSTGTILVSPSLMTIVVDGEHQRVSNGKIVVSCGRHKVRAGMSGNQAVDVPCGGTVSL